MPAGGRSLSRRAGPPPIAALFGLLVTPGLSLILPLGRRAGRAGRLALPAEASFNGQGWPRLVYLLMALGIAALLAGLAIWSCLRTAGGGDSLSARPIFAFVVLRAVSLLVQWLARRAPRVALDGAAARHRQHPPVRGALTPSVVLSLGLGLTLLVTLALIEGNLRNQISGNLPEQAPNFFFVDIQNSEIEDFSSLVRRSGAGRRSRHGADVARTHHGTQRRRRA